MGFTSGKRQKRRRIRDRKKATLHGADVGVMDTPRDIEDCQQPSCSRSGA